MEPTLDTLELDRIQAVSFDVNGTLIHSPRLSSIYAEVLLRHGLEVDADRLDGAIRLVWTEFESALRTGEDRFSASQGGARGFWSRFADRVCSHLEIEPASRFAKAELFDRFTQADAWVVYDDVFDALRRLEAAGRRMAVVSNWDDRLPKLLTNLGLLTYFETVVYSSQVGVEKPFPEIFLTLLDDLELEPESVLHIGDRKREDVEGALAVGMQAIQVGRQGQAELVQDLQPIAEVLTGGSGIGPNQANRRRT